MDLDLVNSVVGLQQAKTISDVQMAVAKKVMDSDRGNGGNRAGSCCKPPAAGFRRRAINLAAAAAGVGGELDTYA